MVVQIQSRDRGIVGLHVGTNNVRRHFPKSLSTIDLELDDLEIQCRLSASFWQDRPEISDPRLSTWLEAKYLYGHSGGAVVLKMVRSGKRSFRLQLVRSRPTANYE